MDRKKCKSKNSVSKKLLITGRNVNNINIDHQFVTRLCFLVSLHIPILLRVECVQNPYVKILSPVTSECDLTWRYGLCRGNQGDKMRSLWCVLIYTIMVSL